ncbi:MAG: DUF177 domain-containing protein [Bacteroidota bacterium]
MSVLQAYVIPVRGLHTGRHEYEFTIDHEFFGSFPDSPIQKGNLQLTIDVDKRLRELVIEFRFEGTVHTECDRCLREIDLSISGEDELLVKITSDPDQVSDEPEMIYLFQEEAFLDLAPFVYEFVLLAVPISKLCQDADPPNECDPDMLAKIGMQEAAPEAESEDTTTSSSPWDVLKDWKES